MRLVVSHTKTFDTVLWLATKNICELETVSIAKPLQNRQHARKTPNAVNTRSEEGAVEGMEGKEEG